MMRSRWSTSTEHAERPRRNHEKVPVRSRCEFIVATMCGLTWETMLFVTWKSSERRWRGMSAVKLARQAAVLLVLKRNFRALLHGSARLCQLSSGGKRANFISSAGSSNSSSSTGTGVAIVNTHVQTQKAQDFHCPSRLLQPRAVAKEHRCREAWRRRGHGLQNAQDKRGLVRRTAHMRHPENGRDGVGRREDQHRRLGGRKTARHDLRGGGALHQWVAHGRTWWGARLGGRLVGRLVGRLGGRLVGRLGGRLLRVCLEGLDERPIRGAMLAQKQQRLARGPARLVAHARQVPRLAIVQPAEELDERCLVGLAALGAAVLLARTQPQSCDMPTSLPLRTAPFFPYRFRRPAAPATRGTRTVLLADPCSYTKPSPSLG